MYFPPRMVYGSCAVVFGGGGFCRRMGRTIPLSGGSTLICIKFLQKEKTFFHRSLLLRFHPETPKQSCSALGWGFNGVSCTASMHDGERRKIA